jgi:MYXO-CTERM domain-containing protein
MTAQLTSWIADLGLAGVAVLLVRRRRSAVD